MVGVDQHDQKYSREMMNWTAMNFSKNYLVTHTHNNNNEEKKKRKNDED